MTLQAQNNMFGEERARRYATAMQRCPTARYLEVLPLLCWLSDETLGEADLVDMGSGTGYLANFFEGAVRSVTRVDKSPQMLAQSGSSNTIVGDMATASQAVGCDCADVVTCLASFHHVHLPEVPRRGTTFAQSGIRSWGPERYLDIHRSLQLQYDAVRDWARVLRPGGKLCLIDVPGYPDQRWDRFWDGKRQGTLNTRAYYESTQESLSAWPLRISPKQLHRYLHGPWGHFASQDPHLQSVLNSPPKNMASLLGSYSIPSDVMKMSGPMVPTDFFEMVVDGYGTPRHFGFFPRETSIADALCTAGMIDIRSATLPAPWLFPNKAEAAWFVHELFGLGASWDRPDSSPCDSERLINLLEEFLGFYDDPWGRTFLYWQLVYFYAVKP
ncbi:MAG: methyltransferase domain-containing protein [Candidatus Brocadiia bacterium]